MKFANGNGKLGDCFVVSRPVGVGKEGTCPRECPFLGNDCYAEHLEAQYPAVRPAGLANLVTDKNRIRAMILEAVNKNKDIRFHERGDWFKNGRLDTKYVGNVEWACESILKEGRELPRMWFYTHIYHPRLAALSKYMAVYASVHNQSHKDKATAAGFKLFAWCDSDKKIAPKRPRHKAKADAWREALPKLVIIDNERFVTCPEIRRGRGSVTCAGTKDSVACTMCIAGLANVYFPAH
jgi:hypothetical protein